MNIIKGFITVGISSILNIVLSLLTTPIITRIIDPVEYGQFNVLSSQVGIVASFLYVGLNESLYRFFFSYKDDEEKTRLLKLCFMIPMALTVVVSVLAIVLKVFGIIDFGYSLIILVILFVNVFAMIWNTLSMEMVQNTKQNRVYSIAILTQKITYTILTISLLLIIKNNYLLILSLTLALSTFVSALIGTYATKKFWNFAGVSFPKNTNEIIKYSIPIGIYFVLYSVYDVLDKLIVKYYCSDYDVGIYSSAFAIVGLFAVIQTAFNIIWRPLQTEYYSNDENDGSFIKDGNRFMTIIMFFMGLNIILFKDILCLFLGESYRVGATLIPLLIFNPIINTLIATATSGIEYSKKSYLRIIIISTALLVEIVMSKLLLAFFGIHAVAISMAISLIIQYLFTMIISKQYYSVDYGISKVLVMIISTFIYSFVNYWFNNPLINIIGYFIAMFILLIEYKTDIIRMIKMVKKTLPK